MDNKLVVNKITKQKNRVEFSYEVTGKWKSYYNLGSSFFIEYDYDLTTIPNSILVVPFLCNVLPLAWICNSDIYIDEVDHDFFNSIGEFKAGYIQMYPMISFKGRLHANLINTNCIVPSSNSALFFSGGVDAFSSLVNHIHEKPTLITIWGADIKHKDVLGWEKVTNHVKSTAELLDLDYSFIKSSFRLAFNDALLNKLVKVSGDSWWHGFQHGIGLIGHAAPLAYLKGFNHIYIASSFTEKNKGIVSCASDPSIDNYVRFQNTEIIHDGYTFERQDKIHNISNYIKASNHNIKIRVCWLSNGGSNCCKCEKCYRTIMGILVEGLDPRNHGFEYTESEFLNIIKDIKKNVEFSFISIPYWTDIQDRYRQSQKNHIYKEYLSWLLDVDFTTINNSYRRKLLRVSRRFLNLYKRLILKIK